VISCLQQRLPEARGAICALFLLVIAVFFPGPAIAQTTDPQFPGLTGRVVDQAAILSHSNEIKLTKLLATHEKATGNQVVVVTVTNLQGYAVEDFALRLGRHWGIGQAGRNNGLLLLVAPKERRVRIEVGYGLEGLMPDALAKLIIEREILPAFKKGNFDRGIVQGLDAILAAIGSEESDSRRFIAEYKRKDRIAMIVFFVVFALFLIFFIYRIFSPRRRKRRWGPGYIEEGFHSGRSGGFGGGGGGGGFSGGGGSFGGGGASGGW
jgi:uncharacterized protein